jgi:hypothetical protein
MNRPYRDDEAKEVAALRKRIGNLDNHVKHGDIDKAFNELFEVESSLCALEEMVVSFDEDDARGEIDD